MRQFSVETPFSSNKQVDFVLYDVQCCVLSNQNKHSFSHFVPFDLVSEQQQSTLFQTIFFFCFEKAIQLL